jgi:hypothetical protein
VAHPITSSSFPRLFDKRIREIFENVWTDLTKSESMIEQVYNVMKSDSNVEEWAEVGAVPDIPEFTGVIQALPVYPGFYNKIEPKEYAGKLVYERKFLDDKKFPVMMADSEGLFTSAHRVREKHGARGFAYAFSSAYDFLTSEEGTSWCSTAHLTKSGVSTTTGFSNAGTAALSASALSAAWLLGRRFKNDIGERISWNGDLLIVPDALGDKAEEIVGTPAGLYSAEGTLNPQKGRFKIIRWKLLDDYSTKMWFLADSRMLKRMNLFINRIPPESHTYVDLHNTLMTEISIYFRIGAGPLSWRCIYGSNPS